MCDHILSERSPVPLRLERQLEGSSDPKYRAHTQKVTFHQRCDHEGERDSWVIVTGRLGGNCGCVWSDGSHKWIVYKKSKPEGNKNFSTLSSTKPTRNGILPRFLPFTWREGACIEQRLRPSLHRMAGTWTLSHHRLPPRPLRRKLDQAGGVGSQISTPKWDADIPSSDWNGVTMLSPRTLLQPFWVDLFLLKSIYMYKYTHTHVYKDIYMYSSCTYIISIY